MFWIFFLPASVGREGTKKKKKNHPKRRSSPHSKVSPPGASALAYQRRPEQALSIFDHERPDRDRGPAAPAGHPASAPRRRGRPARSFARPFPDRRWLRPRKLARGYEGRGTHTWPDAADRSSCPTRRPATAA